MRGFFETGYLRVLFMVIVNLGWIELEADDDPSLSTRATSFH